MAVEKFNTKEGDALSRWSLRRAEGISMANLSAAKYVQDSGKTWNSNGWYFNPYFGMFTFIPGGAFSTAPMGIGITLPWPRTTIIISLSPRTAPTRITPRLVMPPDRVTIPPRTHLPGTPE